MTDSNNILNVQFTADTSGFSAGSEQVQRDIEKLVGDINRLSTGAQQVAGSAAKASGELFRTLQGASDSAIASMMRGTENWHQATLKIFGDMEIRFVQLGANMALDFLRTQALNLANFLSTGTSMVAANDAKNEALAAGDSAASQRSAVAKAEQMIKAIGADNGLSRTIKTYAGGMPSAITLIAPFPSAPGAGDTFVIAPGCDKQQSTCQNKFSNLTNFRGFPYIPENSTAV